MLARLHRDALQLLLGDGLRAHRITGAASTLASLAGQVDGATPTQARMIVTLIDEHGADAIWLDGSNLGHIARAVRHARPNVRVLTFCHNVEARFFLGAARRSRSLRAKGILVGNYLAERLAMRHSTDVIALSDRDGMGLERLYGRGADHVLPMAIADQLDRACTEQRPVAAGAPLLFVGGSFYANQAGIAWFADNVAPRIEVETQVVGQGMDVMRGTLEQAPGVRVIGAVEHLKPLYRDAQLVIAPIFDGSGMKTKVAEALMFGKRVAGTGEAFSGYADDVVQANWLCSDADQFVAAIHAAREQALPTYDPAMRALYDRDHSQNVLRERIRTLLRINAK